MQEPCVQSTLPLAPDAAQQQPQSQTAISGGAGHSDELEEELELDELVLFDELELDELEELDELTGSSELEELEDELDDELEELDELDELTGSSELDDDELATSSTPR
jgi:hypothetical protein